MAIDTQNKRRSVQAYWLGLMRPVPDGAITAPDRATAAWEYSGLGYAPPPASTGGLNWGKGLTPVPGLSIPPGLSPYDGMSKPTNP